MAWTGVWSVDVDGTELNDGINYISMVPEIDNLFPMETVLAPIDGDYPVFIRQQPQPGNFTILVALAGAARSASMTTWDSQMAAIRTLFAQGAYHTLTIKARGMSASKQVRFITESLQGDFRSKTVVVTSVAPNPNLT